MNRRNSFATLGLAITLLLSVSCNDRSNTDNNINQNTTVEESGLMRVTNLNSNAVVLHTTATNSRMGRVEANSNATFKVFPGSAQNGRLSVTLRPFASNEQYFVPSILYNKGDTVTLFISPMMQASYLSKLSRPN